MSVARQVTTSTQDSESSSSSSVLWRVQRQRQRQQQQRQRPTERQLVWRPQKHLRRQSRIQLSAIIYALVILQLIFILVILFFKTEPSFQSQDRLENFHFSLKTKHVNKVHQRDTTGVRSNTNYHTSQLPLWIQRYIAWHNEMISKYPGQEILTNPNAPNLLVRSSLQINGGLHDRLGQLPWDVYLANQTGRMLFIKWERPHDLEEFLVPNEFNWTLPFLQTENDNDPWNNIPDIPSMNDTRTFLNMTRLYHVPEFFLSYNEIRTPPDFWQSDLDTAIARATVGDFRNVKVLRHRLFGHENEDILERRLLDLGETDLIHSTPSFGHLFWAFFTPSSGVLSRYDKVKTDFGLEPGTYSAVHCRVRHPKATPSHVSIAGRVRDTFADRTGLPWNGRNRDFAIHVAIKAMYCARALEENEAHEPIYFFSDSEDLVQYMVHDLILDSKYRNQSTKLMEDRIDAAALKSIGNVRLVSRDCHEENLHIEKQWDHEPVAYYGTFVDLLVAIHARCVTYGVGYFAHFAVKISGTSCKLIYQDEQWGGREGAKIAPRCTNETYLHLLNRSRL